MDFDWADEQIHTHYGTYWLKYFLNQEGDARPPLQIRDAAQQAVQRLQNRATDQDSAATLAILGAVMARARRLAHD